MKYDKWQEEVMEAKGDILVAKGRRIGCTRIMGHKAIEHLMNNKSTHPSSQIICVSLTEDQAKLIILFALQYAEKHYKKYIGKGKDKPTLKTITLIVNKNKRVLMARPVGNTGDATRGFEGQILMVDEASRMPPLFWEAAKPILLTTGGKIWMWSTFHGKQGYFWDRFEDGYLKKDPKARFQVWKKTSEEIMFERPISESWTMEQREGAIKLLQDEKNEMSELQYMQEYMAEPLDDLRRYFTDEDIDECCVLKEQEPIIRGRDYFLGVDIARLGQDKTSFQVIRKIDNQNMIHVSSEIQSKWLTTQTEQRIIELDQLHDFKLIYIDAGSGSLGVGVFDHLRREPRTERKVVAINNRTMALNRDGSKSQRLLKEDLYDNLRSLMQKRHIKLLQKESVMLALRSVQYEYVKTDGKRTKFRIFSPQHSDSDVVEALIRAAECSKEKHINKLLYSFKI